MVCRSSRLGNMGPMYASHKANFGKDGQFQSVAKVNLSFCVSRFNSARVFRRLIFSGGMTTYFFCTSSAAANAFGFVMTILSSGLYGYVVYTHRKAVSTHMMSFFGGLNPSF